MSDEDTEQPKQVMKVVEGRFGGKQEEKDDIPAHTFLAALSVRAKELEEEGRDPKVVALFFEDGYPLEVTATEQYPDGVYFVLGMAQRLIELETLGVVE